MGGLNPMGEKYEKGARPLTPVGEMVEQNAIGLGVMPPIMSLYI